DEQMRVLLNETRQSHNAFMELAQTEFAAFMRQAELNELAAAFRDAVQRLGRHVEQLLQQAQDETVNHAARSRAEILMIAAAVMAVGLVAALLLTRGITRPIRRVADMAGRIATGDLTVEPVELK